MSMETIKRVEQPGQVKCTQLSPYEQQLVQIKANDDLSNQEKRNELDKKILLKANWFANSEKKVVSNRCKQQQVTIRDEVRQAHKAWIKVRREALKQLFEKEFMVYDKEFESMGKAFQRDRM